MKYNELQECVRALKAANDELMKVIIQAKPVEIHNHYDQHVDNNFGSGSNAQVFNSRVTGRFAKQRKQNQQKKEEKKRWKKMYKKNK
jgi:phosphoheptose isomerase